MGNSFHSELQSQKHPLSPTTIDPRYDYLSHWKDSDGQLFLARQIEIPESIGLQKLKTRLQNRQDMATWTSFIFPLDQCYFQHMTSLCSQQERCILTCSKPKNNLQAIFEQRRISGMTFSSQEINLILSSIAKSLQSVKELGESFCPLRMCHIAIDRKVCLMDPILIDNDPFGFGSLGDYPAPEHFSQEMEILSNESLMQAHLFSLGVITLQLAHPKINIKSIYERYHKYGSIVNLNMQALNEHITNVSDPYLRAKISSLTSFNPQTRKNIFKFIEKEKVSTQSKQAIIKQLLISKPINLGNAPVSPLIKSATPIRDKPALKQLTQNNSLSPINNKHSHLQKQQINQNINNKPKVSFNFVSKIHYSANNSQNIPPTSTKKSLSNNNALKKQSTTTSLPLKFHTTVEVTPIRIKKKHNFSTIKQVSQYDECASTSRIPNLQDVLQNGQYDGQILDGKRHGKGIYYFAQGSIYQGQWNNDQMYGYGKLYYPSGKLAYEGGWQYNQFSGKGKVYNDEPYYFNQPFDFTDFNQLGEDWLYYQGNLEQDQKQGKGRLVLSNGQSLYGDFQNDKVHGIGMFSTLSGTVIHGVWNKSILQRTFAQ